jgi:hypothetical protein
MLYKAVVICTLLALPAAAYAGQKETIQIAGDWNVLAKDSAGTLQYGAWRITQQGTNLDVYSRWAHIEAIRQSSGTIAENGTILVIGGPTDGWMETIRGMVSGDGSEITGTWSRVEGSTSSKGAFTASRAKPEAQTRPPAEAAPAAKTETGSKQLIEAPGSATETRPAAAPPVREEPPAAPVVSAAPVEAAPPPAAAASPSRNQPTMTAEPAPDRPSATSDLAALESMLAALVEQNQLLARQLADVRNQDPGKDRQIDAQLAKQQRIFRLLERLIHSKVELEELLEIFRRSSRNP